MQSTVISEGLKHDDLSNLISDVISIDQYKSKVGNDENIVVLAFELMDKEPAQDLSQFLETGHEVLDIDVSQGPNKNSKYNVFVEINRDSKLFATIDKILKDTQRLDNTIKGFKFTSYKNTTPTEFNEENFNARVIVSNLEYVKANDINAQQISERIRFLNEY